MTAPVCNHRSWSTAGPTETLDAADCLCSLGLSTIALHALDAAGIDTLPQLRGRLLLGLNLRRLNRIGRTIAAEIVAKLDAPAHRKPPAPLTVEECVYWLAVVAATARGMRESARSASVWCVTRDVRFLRIEQAQALMSYRSAGGDEEWEREAITVWALCRAAARAAASESKGRA